MRVTAGLRSGGRDTHGIRYMSQVSLIVLKTNFIYIINNARLEKLEAERDRPGDLRVEG